MKSIAIALWNQDNSMTEENALVQAALHNPLAFGALYEKYRNPIYSYLLARVQSVDDAADLTQHVFLRALDALQQYQPRKGSFLTWLLRIAHNAALNFLQRHHQTVDLDGVPEGSQPLSETNVEAELLHREDLLHLRKLTAQLNTQNQEILILRFVSELTVAEIARVIGKSEGATKKQLSRLLQSLKEQYHEAN